MPDRSLTDIFRDCAGTVVYSVAGRDKKRPFVIVGVADEDSGTVYIADGTLHTIYSFLSEEEKAEASTHYRQRSSGFYFRYG